MRLMNEATAIQKPRLRARLPRFRSWHPGIRRVDDKFRMSLTSIRWQQLVLGAALAVVAMLVNVLIPDIRQRTSFPFFFAAVILAGSIGGLWPAVVATLLSTAFAAIYVAPHRISGLDDLLSITVFVLTSGLIAWLSESRLRSEAVQKGLLRSEQQARKAAANRAAEVDALNRGLEVRVRQRTAALASMVKELEAFSYSVSHDLRAPLRSLDGFSQALLEDYDHVLDDEGRKYLHRIRANSQQMGALIDALLQLSRITRKEIADEEVNLSELANGIVRELRSREPERQVSVNIAPSLAVRGDSSLLRIALSNLISNAWKFSKKRPDAQIDVGKLEENGTTTFFVRDNGAGFDMKYAQKLFVAFQRLHHGYEFEGSGIGLATVQRIIRKHGGRIWAEGQPGQGAAFYFTIDERNSNEFN